MRTGHLDKQESWTILTHVALKSIEYALLALTFSEKERTSIMAPLLHGHLPRFGLNSNFPRYILYGPVKKQGLGLHDIFLTQGISHNCNMVSYAWKHNSLTGDLINDCLELLHLEIELSGHIFVLYYDEYKHAMLTKSWVENSWKFISEYGVSLNLDIATPVA